MRNIDDIILFNIISPEAVHDIVKIQVDLVKQRLIEKEITLEVSDDAYAYLSKEGYNPQYGARPLKRVIQNKILTPIASMMISKGVLKGGVVSVGFKNNELTFDVKKGRKGSLWAKSLLDQEEEAEKVK